MKKLTMLGILLLLSQNAISAVGALTNNGSVAVNVIMYNNYIAPTEKMSARGRLNIQGIVIPAGQNVNFLPSTTSIDVYYGNGNLEGIHADVNNNFSYTICPHDKKWGITQDQN